MHTIILRLLAGLVAPTLFATFVVLSAFSPQMTTPPESALTFVSYDDKPEVGALKIGSKLNCAKKSYTLKQKVWTWTCVSKSKQRAYSLVHPDWALELYFATGKKCATAQQVWFVFAPNEWAVGVRSRHEVGTKTLAIETLKVTGGYADYVCR